MCGPTGQEKSEAAQQQQYATTVQNNYSTLFGEQQGAMSNLSNLLTPIAEAGPNQSGMSAAELAAQNTQALNTTGGNYANAARALNTQIAGKGGDSGLESGPAQQLQAGLASSAAGQLSNEQLGITQENAAIGRQNYQNAVSGLQALSQGYGSTAAGQSGTQAGGQAFSEANTIAQQEAQEDQAIGGAIGAGVSALSGGLTSLAASPAGASQPAAFFAGL